MKEKGGFITTSKQPFTSLLIVSNLKWFKYEIIWDKDSTSDFLLAKFRPMQYHENILIFAEGATTYNPQMTRGRKNSSRGNPNKLFKSQHTGQSFKQPKDTLNGMKYPRSILEFQKHVATENLHPSQKPISLYEYLVLTYTNKGDWVLDFCMGSGTTGEACMKLDRNFIGVELREDYFKIAQKRIQAASQQMTMFTDV